MLDDQIIVPEIVNEHSLDYITKVLKLNFKILEISINQSDT